MRLIATMQRLDDTRGVVRVEDVYDTDPADLWEACTSPDRLSRWVARVSGDLREGGTVQVSMTSTWTGPARVDVCDAPHHLLVTMEPGTGDETQVEVWLTADGDRTRLVVEERGLPVDRLHVHGAGWQAHLEDLGRSLETGAAVHPGGWSDQAPAAGWHDRWAALTPAYGETSRELSG